MNKSQVHNGSYLLPGCSLGGYRSLLRAVLLHAEYYSDCIWEAESRLYWRVLQ